MTNAPLQETPGKLAGFLASPYLGLVLTVLFWSGNFVVGRALRDQISPLTLNFWRWAIALAIVLPFTAGSLRMHRRVIAREWKLLVALGFTGIAAFHTCTYMALQTTSAVNCLLLLVITPLFIVAGARIVYRDPVTGMQIAGLSVALVGAVLLIARGDYNVLLKLEFGAGDLWMLLAVLLWTAYSLMLKKRPPELGQMDLLSVTTLAAVAVMLPFHLITQAGSGLQLPAAQTWWGLAYVALFASVFAFLLWNDGVAKVGPNRASMFMYLMPFFGAVLSFIFLGEGVHTYQLIGGVLIFAGIALMNRKRAASPAVRT